MDFEFLPLKNQACTPIAGRGLRGSYNFYKVLARMVVDVTWPWNILWSDDSHYCINGHINTHNCRIWAAENPHAIQEQPLHTNKVIDGAPLHIDRHVKQSLRQHFTGDQPSFSKSMAFSLAGYHPLRLLVVRSLTDNTHRKRPASQPHLKDSIRRPVLDIPSDSLSLAAENMVLLLEHIAEHEAGHIEQF
ncbi:hypothetical protein AVEN_52216-1 [Araneus ventricosus]|uniref:Uncharacterized protein n=1 Tax=Araneus ventricosus TaxID=182803 RepID=A0A4Y2AAD8_ARAVE|nr:hypothetical protein AVEN_52216-1 [Araneus ventricosus]